MKPVPTGWMGVENIRPPWYGVDRISSSEACAGIPSPAKHTSACRGAPALEQDEHRTEFWERAGVGRGRACSGGRWRDRGHPEITGHEPNSREEDASP